MKREGWYDPEEEEFTIPVILGPKNFITPCCGITLRVAPTKNSTGRYWDYNGLCDQCDVNFVYRYHAWRRPSATEKKEKKATFSVLPPEED